MTTTKAFAGANTIADDVVGTREILISADSHVIEPVSIWQGVIDPEYLDKSSATRGLDPSKRGLEMQEDGVVAEVLYPTLGLKVLGIEDVETQEEGVRLYNRWLIDYCNADPDRLIGLGMIACYRPDKAIEELRACHAAGLRGAVVWMTPHPDLPFTSFHYDPIWKVAEELDMPIHLHILSGFNYSRNKREIDKAREPRLRNMDHYQGTTNFKIGNTVDSLFAFIFSGVLQRFPGLKVGFLENEASWLPFFRDQWDYYYHRHGNSKPLEITKPPSEFIDEQVYVTFFRDPWIRQFLPVWGQNNLMWSNDYPHSNSTWPKSRQYVESQLGGLDEAIVERVIRRNCAELYKLDLDRLTLDI